MIKDTNVISQRDFLNQEKSCESKNTEMSDYMVSFSRTAKNFCIGIVDIVNSTKISAQMNEIAWSNYYEIFLNSMASILPRFGGVVIKNQGDSLLYYFPESEKMTKYGFMSCIECGLAMLEEHEAICEKTRMNKLPCLNYRISADYGKVMIMKTNKSSSTDLIGPPVNMCSKINHAAMSNEFVVGGDLFSMVKGFDDYKFRGVNGFDLGFKHSYPVYSVERRHNGRFGY